MLLVQQYKSFSEIDWEHRNSLETFLAAKIPSLDWLEQEEIRLNSKGRCFIFLFFCDKHNIPIGLAFAHLGEIKQKHLGFWQKFSSFSPKKYLQLKWLIPGLDLSCYFHDDFQISGKEKILTLGAKIYKKNKFDLELFKFSEAVSKGPLKPHYFSSASPSLPLISFTKDLQQVYDHLSRETQEGILDLLKHHDDLKFHSDFNADDFLKPEQISLTKKAGVHFVGLTYQGRPLFIGEFWPTETKDYFFDFHLRPAGGEVELRTYYYFFLYKLHEYCLNNEKFKQIQFLRNPLFEHPHSFDHQIPIHHNLINYSLYKNIGQANLESMIHENKRTTL